MWPTRTDTLALPVTDGGDLWRSPKALAALPDGDAGGITVNRLPYPLGGKTYRAIRLTQGAAPNVEQHTFDRDTGMLLVWSTSSVGKDGARTNAIMDFQTMRQTKLPWNGKDSEDALARLRTVNWAGTYTLAVDGAYASTFRITQRWEVTRAEPFALQVRESTAIDYGDGRRPDPVESVRSFGHYQVWLDPALLASLRKGQVLDEDRLTGLRLSVLGTQSGMLIIGEQGAIMQSAAGYDLRTGYLKAVQTQQRNAPGTTTVYLERVS